MQCCWIFLTRSRDCIEHLHIIALDSGPDILVAEWLLSNHCISWFPLFLSLCTWSSPVNHILIWAFLFFCPSNMVAKQFLFSGMWIGLSLWAYQPMTCWEFSFFFYQFWCTAKRDFVRILSFPNHHGISNSLKAGGKKEHN